MRKRILAGAVISSLVLLPVVPVVGATVVSPADPGAGDREWLLEEGAPPGLTITSLTGNPVNTSSENVLLHLTVPSGTHAAYADNGAGDTPRPIDFSRQPVVWTLIPSESSEIRTVKVRYEGPGGEATVTDTITLDPVPPEVPDTIVVPPQLVDKYYVGAIATDDLSGVQYFDVLNAKKHVMGRAFCRTTKCRRVDAYIFTRWIIRRAGAGHSRERRPPAYVRAQDKAGNRSKLVRLHVPKTACKYTVPAKSPSTKTQCFRLGTYCDKQDTDAFRFALARIACDNNTVVKARRG